MSTNLGAPTPRDLQGLPPERALELLEQQIREVLAGLDEFAAATPDDETLVLESLVATEFVAIIESRLNARPSLSVLVEGASIRQLAHHLHELVLSGTATEGVPVVVGGGVGRWDSFSLTDVQYAYWLGRGGLFELGGVSTHVYFEFEGVGLDVGRVQEALRVLVCRHGMLRAVFSEDGRQRVLEGVPEYVVGVLDVRGMGEVAARGVLVGERERLSHEVREAGRWPLFEVTAALLEGDRVRLHVSVDMLIADGPSLQVLAAEWVALYGDPGVVLPPVDVDFRDYVLAVDRFRSGDRFGVDRDYWLGRVDSLPAAPELPVCGGGMLGGSTRFVRREVEVSPARWGRLRAMATRYGVTPSMVLCAAYAEVLRAWGRRSRFTVNVTLGDRLPVHERIGGVVGDFTSLVLLDSGGGEGDFAGRARAIQRQLWRDLDHRLFSGVAVMRELARRRGASQAMMPVVFTSLIGAGGLPAEFPGGGRVGYAISQTPQVLVDNQVVERDGGLVISWDTVDDRFEPGVVDAMFAAYSGLVGRLADDEQEWGRSSVVGLPAEQAGRRRRAGVGAAVPEGLLHDGFAGHVVGCPDATAVIDAEACLTYGELDRLSTRVARWLRVGGAWPVGPSSGHRWDGPGAADPDGELVAVVMPKGWQQVVAVVAASKAGAPYLPLDPDQPPARLRRLLEAGRVRLVLTTRATDAGIAWPDQVTRLAVDDPEAVPVDDTPLAAIHRPDDLAYVIFTSGSTGEPKGVMIDHRGALNTIRDINRRYRVTPDDSVLALSALTFDLSVYDVFGLLDAGGTIVFPEPEAHRDPARWLDLLAAHRVTIWNSVPTLVHMLLEYADATRKPLDGHLRLALLSGDWIPTTLPDRIRRHGPVEVVSLGGATEASIWSIQHPTDHLDPAAASIPYGTALTNQDVTVLDDTLHPRPTHVVGDIYIAGTGLARGYWRDPERTAASFITNPHTHTTHYRTGDLGRYLPDGTIEFHGREDTQVKIGGHRIELGEIENAILHHPAITATAVTATGPTTNRRLTAYITTPNPDLTHENLHHHLTHHLPTYMIPTATIRLDALPLTPNGKINRNALPAPTETTTNRPHTPPQTPTEHLIAHLWTTHLPHQQNPSIHDNFFELGGDSLLALRIISTAANQHLTITPRQFFENPTIHQIATTITPAQPAIRNAFDPSRSGPVELGPTQRWFLSLDIPGRGQWNDATFLLTVQQALDVEALYTALRAVIDTHPALRQRFWRDPDGRWASRVEPPMPESGGDDLPFEVHDLSGLGRLDQNRRVAEVNAALQTSLDLGRGPLLRLAYFDLGRRPPSLLFLAHWLVVDHFSGRVLLGDLLDGYTQAVEGKAVSLPEPGADLWAWTAAERVAADSPETARAADYWRGMDRAEGLPPDAGDGPNDLASLDTVEVKLDPRDTETLLLAGRRRLGVDLIDVLAAALLVAVDRRDGDRLALWVEMERHARDAHPDLDLTRTVGRLSGLVPVHLSAPAGADAAEVARGARASIAAAPGGGLAYGRLRFLAGGEAGDLGRRLGSCVVGLNYVGQVDEALTQSDLLGLPRLSLAEQRTRDGRRPREVDVLSYVAAGRLVVAVSYSRNLHRRETVERLAGRMLAVASEAAAEARALGSDRDPAGEG